MSLGIANAFAVGQLPSQTGADAANDPRASQALAKVAQNAAAGVLNAPTGGAVAVQTERAVVPTPTSAPATVIDFNRAQSAMDQIPEYPISGPDEFARNMADRIPEPVASTPEEGEFQTAADRAKDRPGGEEAAAAAAAERTGKAKPGPQSQESAESPELTIMREAQDAAEPARGEEA